MFVAPAGPIDADKVARCKKRCEEMAFRVRLPEHLNRRDRYLAGSDAERAAELNAALRDPTVDAVFPCRGGYGLTRILDRIDYQTIRDRPKVVIGFSDVTALHLAIARKSRVITFHSPMPESSLFRDDGAYAYSSMSFWRMIRVDKRAKHPADAAPFWDIKLPQDRPKPTVLVSGKARGRLVGGNLSLVCATLGTPYALEPRDRILFLEDTHEKAYRVDRMLCQLRLAGVLNQVAGVLLGTFDGADKKELEAVLREYFSALKVPVLANFPIGHTPYNATLPHGALAELDTSSLRLRILEAPIKGD